MVTACTCYKNYNKKSSKKWTKMLISLKWVSFKNSHLLQLSFRLSSTQVACGNRFNHVMEFRFSFSCPLWNFNYSLEKFLLSDASDNPSTYCSNNPLIVILILNMISRGTVRVRESTQSPLPKTMAQNPDHWSPTYDNCWLL